MTSPLAPSGASAETVPRDARAPILKHEFRQGRHVPRNVYLGDEPLFMAATDELAAELVHVLNAGRAALSAVAAATDGGRAHG